MTESKPKKQSIAIDFDGTLCEYPKFIAPDKIPYEPIEGARDAVVTLSKYFKIVVFSVRAKTEPGKKAIAEWMSKHDIPYNSITDRKPSSVLYIDDNAIRFEGDWKKILHAVSDWKHYLKNKK
jgi:hypothetical protein